MTNQWTALTFGKHRGKTLPQLVLIDPDYFFWALDGGAFRRAYDTESVEVGRRARSIRVPEGTEGPQFVEYLLDATGSRLAGVDLVPASMGASSRRSDRIDLSVPRYIHEYDKLGNRILISAVKEIVFGNRSTRITKRLAEAFFSDDRNFRCGG